MKYQSNGVGKEVEGTADRRRDSGDTQRRVHYANDVQMNDERMNSYAAGW